MVVVAQLVRAPDCGSGGRGFESHLPPITLKDLAQARSFLFVQICWQLANIRIGANKKSDGNRQYFKVMRLTTQGIALAKLKVSSSSSSNSGSVLAGVSPQDSS